ncbi:DUF1642 domain-containing protein [Enterococcus durans]|uniref:DUF1642 domain-containing protein n=1 Tax=Enterococcus durans TaxID=53345 RepID=UPI0011BF1ABB|nr:DUF1642 domain-containing protein [Enterococcus durans]QED60874.1 DUF1642 domain-containing protein [Enterococcus durans]QED63420.1 DUF1642 domain-containing protein [Enterococcus durans]
MNKQELIDKYTTERDKLRPYCPNRNQSEEKLKLGIFTEFIADLKQLDESQKKIIPKCAHEFILEGTGLGLSYFEIITSAESFANAKPQDEFSKWLRENSGLFIRSLLNGYEVEKEPLYEVIIGDLYLIKKFNDRNDFCFDTSHSLCTWEKSAYQLTEEEIKAIDERFWLFAVPVDEVVEG